MKNISMMFSLFYETMIEAFEMRAQHYSQNQHFTYYF